MIVTTQILALKPYLEAVENCCRNLSHEELCEFVRELAQEASPKGRAAFLARLKSRPQPKVFVTEDESESEDLLDDELLERIRELKEDILERQEAIEDGTYYEKYDDYRSYGRSYDDYYYDDSIESLSDEQREEFKMLFAETDHLFLTNDLEIARLAYRSLLNMFDNIGEDEDEETFSFAYGFTESEIKIDWRETRSRYCRCVYETASAGERVAQMSQAMLVGAIQFERSYAPSEGKYPLLQDVIDAAAGELPEREEFLTAWQDALERYENTRAQVLFLEAVELSEGIEGVAREVRRLRMPVGYLYWLDLLNTRQAWPELCEIAQEALTNMPKGELRAQAAKVLNSAAIESGNQDMILQGVREAFYSNPDSMSLTKLIEEACRRNLRNEELGKAVEKLGDSGQGLQLKLRILLMLGRLDEASRLVDTEKALGWSSSYGNPGVGLFSGGLLTALTGNDTRGTTIQALLSRYAGSVSGHSFYSPESSRSESATVILLEIRQGLQSISMEEAERQKWTVLAYKMGGGRIDGIVSKKHRKSYGRAAEVLGALMECELLNEREHEAQRLLETYRNQKYRHYSAFRAELKTVMSASALLKPYC